MDRFHHKKLQASLVGAVLNTMLHNTNKLSKMTIKKRDINTIASTQTVQQALQERCWSRQITGGLSVPAISEYIAVWHAVQNVQLNDAPDRLVWRWPSDGRFSVRSAYEALHLASQPMPGANLI